MTLSRRKAICSVPPPAWIVGAHLRDTSFQLEGRVAAQLLSHGFGKSQTETLASIFDTSRSSVHFPDVPILG